jgi:DNA mismatch endonuclease (patch repair protein)
MRLNPGSGIGGDAGSFLFSAEEVTLVSGACLRRTGSTTDDEVVTTSADARPGMVPSSAAVSARMSRARREHTAPERALRSELHRRGLRFRVQRPLAFDRRRKADIAFPGARVAVFVDGCFWHSCPEHATQPKANEAFWSEKLRRNRERDAETNARLGDDGWHVIRVWEHEDPVTAADRIAAAVRVRSSAKRSRHG